MSFLPIPMKSLLLCSYFLLILYACNPKRSQELTALPTVKNMELVERSNARDNTTSLVPKDDTIVVDMPQRLSVSVKPKNIVTRVEEITIQCAFPNIDTCNDIINNNLIVAQNDSLAFLQRAEIRKRMMAFIKSQAPISELFEVREDTLTIVKTKAGTLLYLQPENLETEDGSRMAGPIQIEIKELLTTSDFCLANAQTVSDNELLVSGGSYFIKCTVDNKPLRLKEGKHLTMKFNKSQTEKMLVFYGNRTDSGAMTWIPESKTQVKDTTTRTIRYRELVYPTTYERKRWFVFSWVKKNTTTTKEWREKKVGFITEDARETRKIGQLGWINLDKFADQPTKRVTLEFASKPLPMAGTAYFIFRRMKSVVIHEFDTMDKSSLRISKMPKGHNVRCVMVLSDGDKLYTASSDFTVGNDNVVVSDLQEVKREEIGKLFRL